MTREELGKTLVLDLAASLRKELLPVERAGIDSVLEERFRRRLAGHYPGDAVIGEELPELRPWEGSGWIIDPVDGTSNYRAGIPHYCVSLAYIENERPILAWIVDPRRQVLYEAARGRGARRDGKPIRVLQDRGGPHSLVAVARRLRRRRPEIAGRIASAVQERCYGALALEMAWVAGGCLSAGVWADGRIWDIAAGVLIVEEAGGTVVDLDGEPLSFAGGAEEMRSRRATFSASAPIFRRFLQGLLSPGGSRRVDPPEPSGAV
ncbi:MAG: inositol monophosphatase family protein [Planctomycetota bacterium]